MVNGRGHLGVRSESSFIGTLLVKVLPSTHVKNRMLSLCSLRSSEIFSVSGELGTDRKSVV